MTQVIYPKVVGLAKACHPVPTIAVTSISVLLAVAVAIDESVAWFLLLAGTVFVGQLSIGWSNDLLDADRDTTAGRQDKPMAVGALDRSTLRVAALVSLLVTFPASLAWGVAGGWHLLLVASGWVYNLWLKPTAISPLCYIVGFGALPLFIYGAAGVTAPWWAVAGGALLGTAAHFANVAPDVAVDLAAGVRGLPQRVGALRSVCISLVLLLACGLTLVSQLPASGPALLLATVAALAPVVIALGMLFNGTAVRRLFPLVLTAALVDTLLLVLAA